MISGIEALFYLMVCLVPFINGEICRKTVCDYAWNIKWDKTMIYRTPEGNDVFNIVLNGSKLQVIILVF